MARFAASNGALELFLYGDVGAFGDGLSASALATLLADPLHKDIKTIKLRINSMGGDAFDGLAIFNQLSRHPARVEIDIDGIAASAASIIAMAGDEIRIASNALMMIHEASGGAGGGRAADHERDAEALRALNDGAAKVYAARTGLKHDEVLALMAQEKYLTAEEAVAKGFATKMVEPQAIAASARRYAMMPQMPAPADDKPKPDAEPQAPKPDGGDKPDVDYNTLGDALAKLTGYDRAAVLAALIEGQDELAKMITEAMGKDGTPAEATAQLRAHLKLRGMEAKMAAEEIKTLADKVAALEADKTKRGDDELGALVDGLIAKGHVTPDMREDAIWAFKADRAKAEKLFSRQIVPVGGSQGGEGDKGKSGELPALETLSEHERMTVQCMLGANMKREDAIKKVVAARGKGN